MLEMECGSLPKAQRGALSIRVRSYRSELNDLSRRLKTVQRSDARAGAAAAADSIREDLFSGGGDQANERSRMLVEVLASSLRLTRAHASLARSPSRLLSEQRPIALRHSND